MRVTRLTLRDFRNFADGDVRPHPRFNVIWGENGQGKTNLLEALFWLASLRPLRASRLRELVRWSRKETRVEGWVEREGLVHRLAVEVQGNARVARREGKQVRASDFFGVLAVVVFTPDDVGLVRGSPTGRRRFLDRAIFTGRPAHLADVLAYRRALDGRNRLLREGAPEALVEVFELTLAQQAARLMAARLAYIEALTPLFEEAMRSIGGAELGASLRYRPSLTGDGVEALATSWAEERSRDRDRGFTQRGPHADDLALGVFDRSARIYASQGQQRAIVLALKIAEIQLLEARHRCTPVLLLDDVSSELDPRRNARLFRFLEGFEGQVFITTTDPGFLKIDAEMRTWQVEAGVVGPRSGGVADQSQSTVPNGAGFSDTAPDTARAADPTDRAEPDAAPDAAPEVEEEEGWKSSSSGGVAD